MNTIGFLSATVYPIVRIVLWSAFLVLFTFLVMRLIFNYADPNPFGTVGRFGFKIRKITERFVYPAARFLAREWKFDSSRPHQYLSVNERLSDRAAFRVYNDWKAHGAFQSLTLL